MERINKEHHDPSEELQTSQDTSDETQGMVQKNGFALGNKSNTFSRLRIGLQIKLAAMIVLPILLVTSILLVLFAVQMSNLMYEVIKKHGEEIKSELATGIGYAIAKKDQSIIDKLASQIRSKADIGYVVILDEKKQLLVEKYDPRLKNVIYSRLPTPKNGTIGQEFVLENMHLLPLKVPVYSGSYSESFSPPPSDKTVSNRIYDKKETIGSILIGFDVSPINKTITNYMIRVVLVSVIIMLICFLASFFLSRQLLVPLVKLAGAARGISNGDLTQSIPVRGNDELAELSTAFGSMSISLRALIGGLRDCADQVQSEASNIVATATQQSAMASQQASAINETSATVSQIAQTSKQATEHADTVIEIAQRSEDLTKEGQNVVQQAMAGMEKLASQVKAIAVSITELRERTLQIGDIISTVKELAEQSNLLALNASIEAAKAGEHGRGFAVLAMEMRNLAEQSKYAAGQVREILSEVQKGTHAAVSATEEGSKRAHAAIALAKSAGTSIMGLADVIRGSSLAARQIANNTRQQTIGVEQIVAAITELSVAMNDVLEGTRRIELVAGNLTTVSQQIAELVGKYRA